MKKLFKIIFVTFILSMFFTFCSFARGSIIQEKVPTSSVGGNMTLSFKLQTDDERDYDNLYAVLEVEDFVYDPDDVNVYQYPFEVPDGNDIVHELGPVKADKTKTHSFTVKVRRDVPAAYYNVYISVYADATLSNQLDRHEYTVYVKPATESSKPESYDGAIFTVGLAQLTPYTEYPQVNNFEINLTNLGNLGAIDVTASLVMSKDKEEFPFDITEANYDRYFNLIEPAQTVQLPYCFTVRESAYTGFYPLKLNITYRESTGGELKTAEKSFYVHVKNKERPDDQGNFNANDRVKARLVVDSYKTDPEVIYAGQDFTLYVNMKNASDNVDASNILFTFESEKVSDSSIFSNENGSNAIVVNELKAGSIEQIALRFNAKAGIDQRSYSMKINEKYDSPEFKNAEEAVVIDIPVHQIAKLNIGSIEIMPDSLKVGDEANIMFPINNTGKVILYNVMARFESKGIQTEETYVGNIKPGETGNVDTMLKAVSADDTGELLLTISYEDEYGNLSSETKDILLYISEEAEEDFENKFEVEMPEEKPPFYKKPLFYIILAIVVIGAVSAFIIIKKKKAIKDAEAEPDDEEEDEV